MLQPPFVVLQRWAKPCAAATTTKIPELQRIWQLSWQHAPLTLSPDTPVLDVREGGEMQPDDPLTVTVEEAAKLLGVSRGLAYELVARGELPALRLGRRRVVPRKAIDALIADACAEDSGESGPSGTAPQMPERRWLRVVTDGANAPSSQA